MNYQHSLMHNSLFYGELDPARVQLPSQLLESYKFQLMVFSVWLFVAAQKMKCDAFVLPESSSRKSMFQIAENIGLLGAVTLPYCQNNKLVYYSYVIAGRALESPRLDMHHFISHSASNSRNSFWSVCFYLPIRTPSIVMLYTACFVTHEDYWLGNHQYFSRSCQKSCSVLAPDGENIFIVMTENKNLPSPRRLLCPSQCYLLFKEKCP